jgi:hypothetical protein
MSIIVQILEMDPSDEDFLPDPERPSWSNVGSKERKPPDKGKCFFIFLMS